eukprot:3715830-Rhodomonas_salina.3
MAVCTRCTAALTQCARGVQRGLFRPQLWMPPRRHLQVQRERERDRERKRERERKSERERKRAKESERERHRHRHTHTHREREIYRQTDMHRVCGTELAYGVPQQGYGGGATGQAPAASVVPCVCAGWYHAFVLDPALSVRVLRPTVWSYGMVLRRRSSRWRPPVQTSL